GFSFLGIVVGLGLVGLGAAFALRLFLDLLVAVFFLGPAQGSAEDVAKRSAGIGGAVLRHGLLLLGDLERLDRDRDLAGLGIDLGHDGIELLANTEAVWALLGAVARQI